MAEDYILVCEDICRVYMRGDLESHVLKKVNFRMKPGEFTAIMGPSGSGKSTLMNIIGCLDRPTSGRLILDGQDVSKCSENELADLRLTKIGFIFQSFHLLTYQTALENVELPLTYAGIPRAQRKERAVEALTSVGLGDRTQSKPTQLSGGQQQRIAIARAMINRPKLLLADEPTGALDSATGRQVMEIFRKLNSEGVSILMITHDPSIAACADRCVTILDGVLSEGLMTEAAGRPAADEAAKAMQTEADTAAKTTQPAAEEIKETKQSAEENE